MIKLLGAVLLTFVALALTVAVGALAQSVNSHMGTDECRHLPGVYAYDPNDPAVWPVCK